MENCEKRVAGWCWGSPELRQTAGTLSPAAHGPALRGCVQGRAAFRGEGRHQPTCSRTNPCPPAGNYSPKKGRTPGQQTPPRRFCLPPARSTKKVREPYVGSSAGAAAPGGSADTGLGAAAESCVPTAPPASGAGPCSTVVSTSTS